MHNTLLTRLSRREIEAFYESGDWQSSTLHQYVQQHSAHNPDRVAVRTSLGSHSYSEVLAAAEKLASHLAGAGLRPGQRVAVWLPNRTEVAVALIACSRLGLVLCPSLHKSHTSREAFGLLGVMGASAFIGQSGHGADSPGDDLFGEVSRVTSIRTVLRVEGSDDRLFGELDSASDPPSDDDPDTVVYLAFTSGTTGQPKGVLHSDNTLLANARALAADWEIDSDSVVYSFSPVSHNLGFGAMVMSLMAGSEFVMHDVGRGVSVADRLRSAAATFVVGVPTHAIDLIAELDARADAPTSVKGFRLSGASGSAQVASALLRHGIRPQRGYGMTEAGSHHYTLPSDGIERVTQTSGKAYHGFEAESSISGIRTGFWLQARSATSAFVERL